MKIIKSFNDISFGDHVYLDGINSYCHVVDIEFPFISLKFCNEPTTIKLDFHCAILHKVDKPVFSVGADGKIFQPKPNKTLEAVGNTVAKTTPYEKPFSTLKPNLPTIKKQPDAYKNTFSMLKLNLPTIKKQSNAVVVMGCGKSAKNVIKKHKTWLDKRITIGVNSIGKSYIPDYYCLCDAKAYELYHQYTTKSVLLVGQHIPNIQEDNKIYYDIKDKEGFSPNKIYHGRTIGIIALNIAIAMQPKKIFLVGFDGYDLNNGINHCDERETTHAGWVNPNNVVYACLTKIASYLHHQGVFFRHANNKKTIYDCVKQYTIKKAYKRRGKK